MLQECKAAARPGGPLCPLVAKIMECCEMENTQEDARDNAALFVIFVGVAWNPACRNIVLDLHDVKNTLASDASSFTFVFAPIPAQMNESGLAIEQDMANSQNAYNAMVDALRWDVSTCDPAIYEQFLALQNTITPPYLLVLNRQGSLINCIDLASTKNQIQLTSKHIKASSSTQLILAPTGTMNLQ